MHFETLRYPAQLTSNQAIKQAIKNHKFISFHRTSLACLPNARNG